MTISHLSTRALGERWSISPRTLERWRCAGEGPRFLKLGGRVVYRIDDIEAFEAAHLRSRTDERATSAVVHPFTPKRGKRRDPVIAAIAPGSLRHRRVANQ